MKHKIAIIGAFAALLGIAAPAAAQVRGVGFELGTVVSVNGTFFTMRDVTNGRIITVNRHTAMANHAASAVTTGEQVVARGRFLPNGVFDALSIEPQAAQVRRGSEVVTIDAIRGDLLIVTDSTNGKHFTTNVYTAARNGEVEVSLRPGERVRLDGYWLANDVFDAEHVVAAETNAAMMPRAGFVVGTIVATNGDLLTVRDASNGRMLTINDHTAASAGRISGILRAGERIRIGGHWLGNGVFDAETIRVL